MNICIFGAGAIGGMIASLLKNSGVDNISIIARGKNFKEIEKNGLHFLSEELNLNIKNKFKTYSTTKNIGKFDLIFITVKAHSASLVAAEIGNLVKKDSVVIPAVNGIPWWYFYKLKGPYENKKIRCVDPYNKQWDNIGPEKILGCVVYPAAEIISPGKILHSKGNRLILGEPDNRKSDRLIMISKMLNIAGFKSPISKDIRSSVWTKLLGNLSFNPLSVLTGATLKEICENKETRNIITSIMLEGKIISEKLGSKISIDIEKRIQGAQKVGNHKTSTLQDYEMGKPIEIDALVKSVSEIGNIVGLKTPTIDLIYSLVKQKAVISNCYPNIS